MSKVKKKKKKNGGISVLKEVDKNLKTSHEEIMDEIKVLQIRLKAADKLTKKKIKRKMRKDPYFSDFDSLYKENRVKLINEMEGNNFLQRVFNILNDVAPIVIIIARLIASLILAILSITSIKVNIKPETLEWLNKVYKKAMAIST